MNGVTNVVVSGTGLTTGSATVYADGSWAKAGAAPATSGNSTYTATALDTSSRTASDSVTVSLPTSVTYSYDGNGNLTSDGRRSFEYDYENQLTNVYVASAWRSEFRYDAFGRLRIRRDYSYLPASSSYLLTNEVRYVYDGMLVVQERDANNIALVSYTRGNDLSGSLQGAGGIGGLLARTENVKLLTLGSALNAHAYYHADGNGNITAMVNTNGIVVARYNYDPYGNMLGMSGPLAEANTYRFSSKEWHGNAGLYYYGFRFYEPNVQRWLNRDPIGEKGGGNLFAVGEFINFFDPFGLDPLATTACDRLINRLLGALENHSDREALGDYLFDNAHRFNMPSGSGFKPELIGGGQNGAVGRHIAAGAGLTLSSRNFGGPLGTRAQSARDFLEGAFTRKKMAEAQAEMADNAASREVGRALLDYLWGQCGVRGDCASLSGLEQRLRGVLCE